MSSNLGEFHHLRRPSGKNVVSVVMCSEAYIRIDESVQRLFGDCTRELPGARIGAATQRTVAHEGELTSRVGRPLLDHTADAMRKGGACSPVEDDLGDGALTSLRLVTGLIVNGLGHALGGGREEVGSRVEAGAWKQRSVREGEERIP